MSEPERRIHLPGIALNQPDVYETPGAPDGADSKKKYEDDSHSASVSKLECGVGKSYESFKHKAVNGKDVDFSDEVRQGFGGLPDCIPNSGRDTESLVERYKRLTQEISEFLSDMEHLKPSDQGEAPVSTAGDDAISVTELQQLQVQLKGAGLGMLLGQDSSPAYSDLLTKNLLSKLEEIPATKPSSADASSVVYELYHKPEAAKFAHLSKLSQLEERLAELEAIVGLGDPKAGVVSGGLDEKTCITEKVASLHSKVALLDQSHVAAADMRLQGLLKSMQLVKDQQAQLSADDQSKVSEVYDTVKRWDCVAPLLPELIDRLHTLKDLHQQAADFSTSLTQLDNGQAQITQQLTADQKLLSQLKTTFTDNMAEIQANCKSLEARVSALKK